MSWGHYADARDRELAAMNLSAGRAIRQAVAWLEEHVPSSIHDDRTHPAYIAATLALQADQNLTPLAVRQRVQTAVIDQGRWPDLQPDQPPA